MKGFLRRLRGIIGTGLTWAVGWIGLFVAYLLREDGNRGRPRGGTSCFLPLLEEVFVVGTFGFLAGSTFGALLSVLEGHKSLEEITFKRIAAWGGLGGLAVVALVSVLVGSPTGLIFYSVLGVGSATGTVALAKRADTKLIEGDAEPLPEIGGGEKRVKSHSILPTRSHLSSNGNGEDLFRPRKSNLFQLFHQTFECVIYLLLATPNLLGFLPQVYRGQRRGEYPDHDDSAQHQAKSEDPAYRTPRIVEVGVATRDHGSGAPPESIRPTFQVYALLPTATIAGGGAWGFPSLPCGCWVRNRLSRRFR